MILTYRGVLYVLINDINGCELLECFEEVGYKNDDWVKTYVLINKISESEYTQHIIHKNDINNPTINLIKDKK